MVLNGTDDEDGDWDPDDTDLYVEALDYAASLWEGVLLAARSGDPAAEALITGWASLAGRATLSPAHEEEVLEALGELLEDLQDDDPHSDHDRGDDILNLLG